MKKLLIATLMASFFVSAFAQLPWPAPLREIPGEMEFTGRVVARPVQAEAWLARGVSENAADFRLRKATSAIQQDLINYVDETDEYILDVPDGMSDVAYIRQLILTGNYEYVTPDWRVYPAVVPNDNQWAALWGHVKCNTPQAWDLFTGNNSVTVANCDTGVRLDHQEFAGQLVMGFNAVTNLPQASGGQVGDLNGHGSHTMGTQGARGNNAVGITGIGWNFKLMPIRVSDLASGSAYMSDLTQGARWAADSARAINCSYSGVNDPSVQTTGNYIKYTRNGLLCWASGNSGALLSGFDWADVLIVGATDSGDNRASFSNYGVPLDVYAPGVGIRSCYNSSSTSYGTMDGTSMAAPFVTGLAALLMASNPDLSASNVESLILYSSKDLGAAGNDSVFGRGRVDVQKALRNAYNQYWFLPNAYQRLVGSWVAGGLGSVRFSDAFLSKTKPVLDGTGFAKPVEFAYYSDTTNKMISGFTFSVEAWASAPGYILDTYLQDRVSFTDVLMDSRPAPTSSSVFTVSPANPVRYADVNGKMKARLVLRPVVPTTSTAWNLIVNQVKWQTNAP